MLKSRKIVRLPFAFLLCIILGASFLYAANPDSLITLVQKKSKNDTSKISLLLRISEFYKNDSIFTAEKYLLEASDIASQQSLSTLEALIYLRRSELSCKKTDYLQAIEFAFSSLQIYNELKDSAGIIDTYIQIGNIYSGLSNFNQALAYYNKASRISTIRKNPTTKAIINEKIGDCHYQSLDYDKALQFFTDALTINQAINRKQAIMGIYNKIGILHNEQKRHEEAVDYFFRQMIIAKELNDWDNYINGLRLAGTSSLLQNDIQNGMLYLENAYILADSMKNRTEQTECLISMAKHQFKKQNYQLAISKLDAAKQIAKNAHSFNHVKSIDSLLFDIYENIGNYKNAYISFLNYLNSNDTIQKHRLAESINEMNMRYETEKKEKQLSLLSNNRILQKIKYKKNIFLLHGLIAVSIIIISFSFYILKVYRRFLSNTKVLKEFNSELNQQKEEIIAQQNQLESLLYQISNSKKNIEIQRDDLKKKQTYIMNNIRYSKIIQDSVLPAQKNLNQLFDDFFVLFMPKDIVSGDLYWTGKTTKLQAPEEELIFFAAVDCTGHGVPGAFMSIVSYNLLNKAIHDHKIQNPAEILNFLDSGIKQTLRQSSNSQMKEGMDIALCCYDKCNNTIEYAGAFSPLYLIRNKELIIYEADSQPIGISFRKEFKPFKSQTIHLQKNDIIYLFSDGYFDQFGGPKRKKMLKSYFRKLLLQLHELPMGLQHQSLEKYLTEWKNDNEQVDDILVFGIKFKNINI